MPKPTNKKPFYSDLSVRFLTSGTINTQIETLSELFTEWFLYDSTTVNTLDSFIADNNLDDFFSVADFTDLICGGAYLDEALTKLIPLLLPFQIPETKMHKINEDAKLSGARMIQSDSEVIYDLVRQILQDRTQERKEHIRAYKKERSQRPDVQEQERQRHHEYYVANRETIKEKRREYAAKNREKIAAYKKEYQKKNREKIATRRKQYELEHKESISARRKKYYLANREYIIEMSRKYAIEHSEQIKERRHNHYVANKDAFMEKWRQYVLTHREQVAAYQKQYREQHIKEMLSYEAQYREEHADLVSARKKKCYHAKKEEYQAKHKAYYEQHREEIAAQQRAKREKEKVRDESAKSVCPTFLYLLQMRHDHRADFVKLLGQRDMVGFAIKKCPALQEMDYTKCAFCDGTENPHTVCEMQKMATMPSGIIETMPDFVAIIKAKQQTTR